MKLLKLVTGKILYAISFVISKILDVLIAIIEVIVTLVNDIKRLFIGLIGMGGCLLLIFFPFTLALLMNPITIMVILFLVIFPILGTSFISYIKYLKYMITEFLFDHANYLMHGQNKKFNSFSEYGDRYKRAEEAKRRKAQEERRAKQQREWEERFRAWGEYQNSQRDSSQGHSNWQRQTNYNHQHVYVDPSIEFKKKYQDSCDILGVGYNTDKYQIKLAYRKKAKKYHPDINKSPEATKAFQQINNAYEFLSDEHIERYNSMR